MKCCYSFSIICMLFFVNPYLGFSQAPGYQGKRIIVNYDFQVSPAFILPDYSRSEYSPMQFINTKHILQAEYILDRKNSLGILTRVYKTGINLEETFESTYTCDCDDAYSNSGYYDYDQGSFDYRPYNPSPLTAFHLGVSYKFYSENIAPVGVFHQFDLEKIFFKVKLNKISDEESFYAATGFDEKDVKDLNVTTPNIPEQNSYGATMIGYTIGKQRVIFDKIILRSALQFGWVLGGMRNNKILELDFYNKYNYIENMAKAKLNGHNFFNLNVGIGFLAY